jgi:uncharacterized membrane protein YphA (DoxX/SURF4 family)
MDVVLWGAAIGLAVVFLVVGTLKLVRPLSALRRMGMTWVDDWGRTRVRLVGMVEVLGAVGLVVPAATRIAPWLTPLAAGGLAVVMVGAVVVRARRHESVAPPLGLFVVAATLAVLRFGPYPL